MSAKKTHKALLKDFMGAVTTKVEMVRDGDLSQEEFLQWMQGYASAAFTIADAEEEGE